MFLTLYYVHFLFNAAVELYTLLQPLLLSLYISPLLIYKYIEDKTHNCVVFNF